METRFVEFDTPYQEVVLVQVKQITAIKKFTDDSTQLFLTCGTTLEVTGSYLFVRETVCGL